MKKKAKSTCAWYGYMVMLIFTALAGLMLSKKEYATAATHLSLAVALGGSGMKEWKEIPLLIRIDLIALSCIAVFLWAVIIGAPDMLP